MVDRKAIFLTVGLLDKQMEVVRMIHVAGDSRKIYQYEPCLP
jgi:hypothetical protein